MDAGDVERSTLTWRGGFDNGALDALHAHAFGTEVAGRDWAAQLDRHSLGWVCAHDAAGRLTGFVNVAWDGGVHAFILDTMVHPAARRTGLATAMVTLARHEARAAGCEWLHVDFEPHLRELYLDACGFSPTDAGLIALQDGMTAPGDVVDRR